MKTLFVIIGILAALASAQGHNTIIFNGTRLNDSTETTITANPDGTLIVSMQYGVIDSTGTFQPVGSPKVVVLGDSDVVSITGQHTSSLVAPLINTAMSKGSK